MLHLPDGRRFFPSFLGHTFSELAPVKQYQILQKTVESLDVGFVVARPMTAEEETAVTRFLQERLGYPFKINFTYVDAIERVKSGKFEEFKSEITPPSRSQRSETAAA